MSAVKYTPLISSNTYCSHHCPNLLHRMRLMKEDLNHGSIPSLSFLSQFKLWFMVSIVKPPWFYHFLTKTRKNSVPSVHHRRGSDVGFCWGHMSTDGPVEGRVRWFSICLDPRISALNGKHWGSRGGSPGCRWGGKGQCTKARGLKGKHRGSSGGNPGCRWGGKGWYTTTRGHTLSRDTCLQIAYPWWSRRGCWSEVHPIAPDSSGGCFYCVGTRSRVIKNSTIGPGLSMSGWWRLNIGVWPHRDVLMYDTCFFVILGLSRGTSLQDLLLYNSGVNKHRLEGRRRCGKGSVSATRKHSLGWGVCVAFGRHVM